MFMKIERLYIKNIGPFKEATLEFPTLKTKKQVKNP